MKPLGAGVEAIDDSLQLGRHGVVVQRCYQHQHICLQHFWHEYRLDSIIEDTWAVHVALITSAAGMSLLICCIKGKNLMTCFFRTFNKLTS